MCQKDVELIFRNLISNTLKYAEAEHIYIAIARHEQALIIDYRDDGIGMAISSQEALDVSAVEMLIRLAADWDWR